MRMLLSCSLALLLITGTATFAAAPEITTDEQKALYALGLAVSRSLGNFMLSEAELEIVKVGITDGALQRTPKVDLQAYMPKLQELQKTRIEAMVAVEKKAGEEFQKKAAAEKGVEKTASGLLYKELKAGTGAQPALTDKVKVNYRGTLIDGTEFDSSYKRNEPTTFPLNGVIKCWTEGVQRMKVGEKAKLTCPSDLAYGDEGRPPTIPGGATLTFDVELLEIVNKK